MSQFVGLVASIITIGNFVASVFGVLDYEFLKSEGVVEWLARFPEAIQSIRNLPLDMRIVVVAILEIVLALGFAFFHSLLPDFLAAIVIALVSGWVTGYNVTELLIAQPVGGFWAKAGVFGVFCIFLAFSIQALNLFFGGLDDDEAIFAAVMQGAAFLCFFMILVVFNDGSLNAQVEELKRGNSSEEAESLSSDEKQISPSQRTGLPLD